MAESISGVCEERFLAVKEAFEQNFAQRNEVGAGVSVYHKGKKVVDLYGGMANDREEKSWQDDTIVNVFSSTKGVTAICAHRLVEEGKLDLNAPVSKYWPEFTGHGKEDMPVEWLLSHRAGLPAVRELLPENLLYDWDGMCAALAGEEPWWEPGTAHGYHAITYGWLVGEVIRRVTGLSVGEYFKKTFAESLGLDFQIGVPVEQHGRIAHMGSVKGGGKPKGGEGFIKALLSDAEGVTARAMSNPPGVMTGTNSKEWRCAEIPSANGHSTASALARLYAALSVGGSLDGVHVLNAESLQRCLEEKSMGEDEVLKFQTRFSLGFMLTQQGIEGASFGPNKNVFGHPGAGGSVGFADLDAEIGFGYVMNRMGPQLLMDPRGESLVNAVYQSL